MKCLNSPDSIDIDPIDISTPPEHWIRRKSEAFHTSESSKIDRLIENKLAVRSGFNLSFSL